MKGHVIVSHGLQSSPQATKATALAQAARDLGWSVEVPDYRDIDALGELGDVHARLERLQSLARPHARLVLAGSSMGAFISARTALQSPVLGLFLMAPPVVLRGFDIGLDAPRVPTRIVHGWHDELIPADAVVRWAGARGDRLVLVDDSHRLESHVAFCAREFARFLQAIA